MSEIYCPICKSTMAVQRRPRHSHDRFGDYGAICDECGITITLNEGFYSEEDLRHALYPMNRTPPAHKYTLEELRGMGGDPAYIVFGDGKCGWAIVSLDHDRILLYNDELWELDEDFYNMEYNDPAGHFGLHVLGWAAYDREPEEEL